MRFALPILAAALLGTVPAQAQEEVLDYQAAMRCSVINTYLTAANEDGDDPELAASVEEQAERWLVMAMVRDGNEGERALEEFDVALDGLINKLDTIEEADFEPYLVGHIDRCTALIEANYDEFVAIELEE